MEWDKHRGMAMTFAGELIERNPHLENQQEEIADDIEAIFWEAEQKFDPTRGVAFLSYAGVWVKRATRDLVERHAGTRYVRGSTVTKRKTVSHDFDRDCDEQPNQLDRMIADEERELAAGFVDKLTGVAEDQLDILRLAPRMPSRRGGSLGIREATRRLFPESSRNLYPTKHARTWLKGLDSLFDEILPQVKLRLT